MAKIAFKKPGNFIYPVPAVMVSLKDKSGKTNILTVAWTGTICSDPPMAYISVRKNRGSYPMLMESGEFVINLPDEKLVKALDYCGVRSVTKVDKWKEMGLHEGKATVVSAPTIEEAPVSIECKVTQVLPLGTHDMFLAEVVAVQVDDRYIDEKDAFHMDQVGLVAYSHGDYMSLGEKLGSFGYSVRKKPLPKKKAKKADSKPVQQKKAVSKKPVDKTDRKPKSLKKTGIRKKGDK
ncbi:DIM6/NTAB family protein [Lachnospiraceae bacterium JC7]|nr:DIM6/NTAB family protein [Lachnospiraceae bacterium JC7]